MNCWWLSITLVRLKFEGFGPLVTDNEFRIDSFFLNQRPSSLVTGGLFWLGSGVRLRSATGDIALGWRGDALYSAGENLNLLISYGRIVCFAFWAG
jgi:hypothetical protein